MQAMQSVNSGKTHRNDVSITEGLQKAWKVV